MHVHLHFDCAALSSCRGISCLCSSSYCCLKQISVRMLRKICKPFLFISIASIIVLLLGSHKTFHDGVINESVFEKDTEMGHFEGLQLQKSRHTLLKAKCLEYKSEIEAIKTPLKQILIEPKSKTIYCYLFKGTVHGIIGY